MAECPACGEVTPERARFCLSCGEALGESPATGVGMERRRNVSIVFADLAGSTVLGESLDAEALRYVTGRFFETMRAAVEAHQGVVEKFIGDAVVAVFGVPRVREDDALRAVRAAADMRAALPVLNQELERELAVRLEVRIGVNTGEVVLGESRAGGSRATGDAVNVAARLEQAAGPGEVLIGERTHRLVRQLINADPVEPLALKGKAEPVAAWRLLSVTAPAGDVVQRLSSSGFVGRDSQLRLLDDAFHRAQGEQACQLVTVLGVAGMGKSRLAEEFAAGRADALVLRGRCLSYGQGATYWPLREAIFAATGLTGEETADELQSALAAAMGDAPDAANVVTRLLALAGFNKDATVPEDMPWAVRTFLESLAREQPVVLVVDDLHWAEPGLLDVIEHVADWSRDAAIMLLGMARPEFYDERPTWGGGKLNATAVLLSPLDETAGAALLDKHDLPANVKARVIEAGGGNPLFTEQLVAMLADQGRVVVADGVATWSGGPADDVTLSMPASVAALLAARIDRLDDDERTVLGSAAVVGPVFYVDACATLTGQPFDEVRRLLDQLVRKELLRPTASDLPSTSAYRFLHALVRDAAYDGLGKATRAQWHEAIADWLASLPGEAVPDEIIGHHLASACDYRRQLGPVKEPTRDLARRAARRLAAAGRRLEVSDLSAAASLWQRAVDLLDAGDTDFVDYQNRLGAALLELGEIDRAITVLRVAAASTDERLSTLARVLLCRANGMTVDSRVDESLRVVTESITRFGEWDDHAGLAQAYIVQADLFNFAGHTSRTAEPLRLARAHAEAAGDVAALARARSLLVVYYLFGPAPAEEVITTLDRDLAESGNDPRVRAEVEQTTCVMHAMCGRFAEGRALGALAREHLAQVGHGLFLATLAQSTGHVEELAGDLEAARQEYERSIADLSDLGESSYLSTVAGLHARLLARTGDVDGAIASVELARARGSVDDVTTQSLIHQTEALLAASSADAEVARSHVAAAMQLEGTSVETPDPAGEVCLVGADVEHALGDVEAEREYLSAAARAFAMKGNVVRVGEVEARLNS